MDHRAELIRLITAGTSRLGIYDFFLAEGFEPHEIDKLVSDCGVSLPRRMSDFTGVTDERRRELQELSTRD
jgi:hypothetical protein